MDPIEAFLRVIAPHVPAHLQVVKLSLQSFGQAIIEEAEIENLTIIRDTKPRQTVYYQPAPKEHVLVIGREKGSA